VLSEWVQGYDNGVVAGRMVRRGDWKLIRFNHADIPDQLFNLATDPDELHNRADDSPEIVKDLAGLLEDGWEPERVAAEFDEKGAHIGLLNRWHRTVQTADAPEDVWRVPPEVNRLPEYFV